MGHYFQLIRNTFSTFDTWVIVILVKGSLDILIKILIKIEIFLITRLERFW